MANLDQIDKEFRNDVILDVCATKTIRNRLQRHLGPIKVNWVNIDILSQLNKKLVINCMYRNKYDDNSLVTSEVDKVEHVNVPLLYFLYDLPRRSFDLI